MPVVVSIRNEIPTDVPPTNVALNPHGFVVPTDFATKIETTADLVSRDTLIDC
jgi:hypothetical protein